MITKERLAEMHRQFWAETNDPKSKEWRNRLTPEEAAIVEDWDDHLYAAFSALSEDLYSELRGE